MPEAFEGVAALVDWHGIRAEDTLLAPARDTGAEVHIVGDAVAPRSVHAAIAERI